MDQYSLLLKQNFESKFFTPRNRKTSKFKNNEIETILKLQEKFVKGRWTFLDQMEDSLKDVLNYYESFWNQLADFEQVLNSNKDMWVPEISIEEIENSNNNTPALEIIEEKDSVPTSTSNYSPVDRVETEPTKK